MSPKWFRTSAGRGRGETAVADTGRRPHARIAARAARVRRRPWRKLLALGTVLALVAGVVFLFGWSQAFVARSVAVEGVDDGLAKHVVDVAQVPGGRPLARVDTAEIAERVLADKRLASAEVARRWPSTIAIEVTKRTPAIALNRGKGKPLEIADDSGVVYQTVKQKPKGLPQLVVRGETAPEDIGAALDLLEAVPDDVRSRMGALRLLGDGRLQFKLEPDITVKWGLPGREELKARVLQALLEQHEVATAELPLTVNLTAPEAPVVTGLPEIETDDAP